MLVSGLPDKNERHAEEVALLALEILKHIDDFEPPYNKYERLKMRIGLHTGLYYSLTHSILIPGFSVYPRNLVVRSATWIRELY